MAQLTRTFEIQVANLNQTPRLLVSATPSPPAQPGQTLDAAGRLKLVPTHRRADFFMPDAI
jgi:hypothetical protein